ncbi:MAG: class I SAM-dependent methyltransferase [Gemmatimonadota bacterium]
MRDLMPEAAQPPEVEYGYKTAAYKTPNYLLEGVNTALAPLRSAGMMALLELGCGNGYVAAQLASAGWRVTATDISAEGVAVARETYAASGARFVTASIYDATLAQRLGTFDVVLAIEVIEHLQLPRELLRRAFDVLRPGGRLVVTTPYHGYFKNLVLSLTNRWDAHFAVHWDAGHLRFFSPAALTKMALGCGFLNARWTGMGRVPGLWKSFLFQAERPALR